MVRSMLHASVVALATNTVIGITLEPGKRYASLDGDADRVVFFFEDDGMFSFYCCFTVQVTTCYYCLGKFRLLDGDKISSLVRITFDCQ